MLRKIIQGFLILLTMLVVLVGVTGLVLGKRAASRLDRALAAIEDAGFPMDPAAIIPEPVPDSGNAAPLYLQAYAQMTQIVVNADVNLKTYAEACCDLLRTNATAAETVQGMRDVLARDDVASVITLIETGTAKPACRFDLDYSAGAKITIDHVLPLRAIQRLVILKALVEAQHGRDRETWQTFATALRVGDALRREPLLISQLVRSAQLGMTLTAMDTAAQLVDIEPVDADALRLLLMDLDDRAPFVTAMHGERLLLGRWFFELQPETVRHELKAWGAGGPSWPFRILPDVIFAWNQAVYMDRMRESTALLNQPPYKRTPTAVDSIESGIPRGAFLASLLLPPFEGVARHCDELITNIRLAQIALALRAYKNVSGTYPETLDSVAPGLTPGVNADPFTGDGFLYRSTGDAALLYSIGADRHDDGGTQDMPTSNTPDIVKVLH
jgi:hypothetical protein